MPADIQAQAEGLLSVLGIKNMGQQPSEFGNTVVPTLPLLEWYLTRDAEVLNGSRNIGAGTAPFSAFGLTMVTGVLAAVIPERQWWYVHDAAVTLDFQNVNDTLIGDLGVSYFKLSTQLAGPLVRSGPYDIINAVASPIALGAGGNIGRWFPSGTQFAAFVGRLTMAAAGAAATFNLRLTVTRVQV